MSAYYGRRHFGFLNSSAGEGSGGLLAKRVSAANVMKIRPEHKFVDHCGAFCRPSASCNRGAITGKWMNRTDAHFSHFQRFVQIPHISASSKNIFTAILDLPYTQKKEK